MEDFVSAAITVSASLVTMVMSAREVCDGFRSLINEIMKKKWLLENAKGIPTMNELENKK